jgi:hypothetical protein
LVWISGDCSNKKASNNLRISLLFNLKSFCKFVGWF